MSDKAMNSKQTVSGQPPMMRGRGPFGGGHGPGGMGRPVEKPKDFKGTLKRLVAYLKPHKTNLVVVLIFAVASTTFMIASPKIIGKAMNKLKDGFVARSVLHKMSDMQKQGQEMISAYMRQGTAGAGQAEDTAEAGAAAMPQLPQSALDAVKQFMTLPLLDNVEDSGEKADIVEKLINLAKYLPLKGLRETGISGAGAPGRTEAEDSTPARDKTVEANQSPSAKPTGTMNLTSSVSLTKEQIEDAYRAIRETGGRIDFRYIGIIALVLIGMYLLSAGFSLVMGLVMSGVAQNTVHAMRRDVEVKLSRLPLEYYDGKTHGEILSRVTNDIDTISATLQQSITQLITSVVQLAGYIIMMLTISPVLTLIVIATMPLYIFATAIIAKKSQKYFAAQQKELGNISGHVEEMYTGHTIVKAFGKETDSIDKFGKINDRLYDAGWKANFVSGIMFPVMNFISNLGYVLISVVGGLWMTKSILNLGDITAFIQYSRSFTMPIVQTANIANIIQSTVACAERVFEVLDEEEEKADAPDARIIDKPRGEVIFSSVDFRYTEDVPLIHNLNLEVKEGHTIAIVGPTGAGKTTLVNLLMRFYEINGGGITVDGVDIRNIKRGALRSMFGMVLQDTWLFNGTIRDNIAYGRENVRDEDIVRVAKAAHADHFIRTLPEGYNTVLNEEATNISQGQKQLLTIARALLADPAILILDEATSNVDTRTEVLIQKAMEGLMKGRTSFVIAHRLSTIRDAELILVMNQGSIIETGTHYELLEKGGFYAELYRSQFKGGIEGCVEAKAI